MTKSMLTAAAMKWASEKSVMKSRLEWNSSCTALMSLSITNMPNAWTTPMGVCRSRRRKESTVKPAASSLTINMPTV